MNENTEIPSSIFKHTTLTHGDNGYIHIVYPDKIPSLLKDETFDADKLKEKLEGDQFDYDLKPVLVVSADKIKKYYTPAQKKAIIKYRANHKDQYNEQMRNIYGRKRQDEEWLKSRNEKAKEANKKYREKKKSATPPQEQKPRGRPKKVKTTN
jgi:hypothetical protein